MKSGPRRRVLILVTALVGTILFFEVGARILIEQEEDRENRRDGDQQQKAEHWRACHVSPG